MLFFRRFGLGLAVVFFSFLLFTFALALTIFMVLDRPAPLQKALRASGIYSVFVERTLAEKQRQGEVVTPSTDVAQVALRQATAQALSLAFIQNTAEQSLNQAYDWLHGRTNQLGLAVDTTEAKERFASSLASYVQQRAASLPACPGAVQPPATLDELLAINCVPPGASAETLTASVRQEALKDQSLDRLVLTADNLKDEQGRPLSQRLESVPRAHHYFVLSLYIMPLLIALCALAIIFGSATRRGGMKRAAHLLLWTGVFSIAWALAATWGLNRLGSSLANSGEAAALQSNILRAVNSLAADMRTWWAGIGAAYALAGAGMLVYVHVLNKRTVQSVEALNKSMGYNNVPSAGTTFDPDKKLPAPQEGQHKPKPPAHSPSSENKNSPK